MSKAIGIDLGTTHSAAGLKKLQVEIIANAEGDLLTPSVVALQKQTFVVGKYARQWFAQDPENTVTSIKRLMGRHFNDPEVQKLLQENRFSYTVKPLTTGSEHSLAVQLNGQEYTPEEISSKIIAKICADCEKALGDTVEYAVVTVPAYFNDKQTHVTRLAAARAGLKVQRLLPEPTAAAISFGVEYIESAAVQTILVFDFGGGTFDISILTIRDGQFIEQGKGGDMWMGGDDIDALIVHYVYKQTEETYSIESLATLVDMLPKDKRNRFLSELKQKVETAKIVLSEREKTVIEILGLLKDRDGDIIDIEVALTRQAFEELLMPLADKSVSLVKDVIAATDFDLALIDKVVMVGGSSSIPLIAQKMQALFGHDKVFVHPRPMLAITEGAAIMAHRLADHYECPGCGASVVRDISICGSCQFDLATAMTKTGVVSIVHTTSHDYFLVLEKGEEHLLVAQNTPLPFQTQATFRLVDPEQNLAHFKFFNRTGTLRESIGDLWLSFDMDEGEEEPTIEPSEVVLDFDINEDNIITVAASLKNRPHVKIGRTLSRGKGDEKLFLELEQTIDRSNQEGWDYYVSYEFLQRSIVLATTINQMIDPHTGEEDPQLREKARFMLDVAQQLMAMKETPSSNGYYAEGLLMRYGFALTESASEPLQKALQIFQEANAHGSVEIILAARDRLMKEVNQNYVATLLKDVDDAAEMLAAEDPGKAPRLEQYSYDLTQAVVKGDRERYNRLAKEVQPELNRIFSAEKSRKFHIWKEISK